MTSKVDSNQTPEGILPRGNPTVNKSRPTLEDLRLAQPPPLSEGYPGLFYRKLSLPITWLVVQTPITANQITVLWLILGMVGVFLLASGTYLWTIFGALLLELAAVLDRVDGEVARYKHSKSLLGIFLDLTAHTFIRTFLFLSISLGVFWSHSRLVVILLGISAASSLIIGDNLRFFITYIFQKITLPDSKHLSTESPIPNDFRWNPKNTLPNSKHLSIKALLRKLLMKSENLWRTIGLFGFVLVGAVSNTLYFILIFYGIATPIWAVSVLIRMVRKIHDQDVSYHAEITTTETI